MFTSAKLTKTKRRRIFKKKITKPQVKLVSEANIKVRTKWVLFTAAFIDLSGAVLLQGGAPLMCANAPGATPMDEVPGAFPATDFEVPFLSTSHPPALDYAMAINLMVVANMFGGIFSNYISGWASDRFGRKVVILLCLLGGVVSYVLMFVAGFWVRNYWMFLSANFVNGLFSGIRGVISAYLQDIHDPLEFRSTVMPTMMNFFLFGAMGGSLIGTVWVAIANSSPVTKNTTLALFGPAWLGVLLSTGSAIMVQRLCPEPPRKEEAKGDDDDNKKAPDMTRTQRLVITIILVAGSLDAFGDYGNKFARNTILTNRYPLAREAVVNYVLMGSNIFSIYVGKVILTRTISRIGFMEATGLWCIVGNLVKVGVQLGLLTIVDFDESLTAMGWYVFIWILSQVFGICSTLASMFLYPGFLPTHRLGELNGLKNSLLSTVNCITPILLSSVYQTGSLQTGLDDADRRSAVDHASVLCLAICGTVSFLAFIGYLPLRQILPKTPKPPAAESPAVAATKGVVPEEEAVPPSAPPLSYYDTITWQEWSSLPMRRRFEVQRARARAGMERVRLHWGTWHDDCTAANDILSKAPKELGELRELYTEWVTSDEKLEEIAGLMATRRELEAKRDKTDRTAQRQKERAAMGQWIADYLDDAGYDWEVVPELYKAMVMNSFPPLDTLDEKQACLSDIAELRTFMVAFLKVLDMHIKSAETTSVHFVSPLPTPEEQDLRRMSSMY